MKFQKIENAEVGIAYSRAWFMEAHKQNGPEYVNRTYNRKMT